MHASILTFCSLFLSSKGARDDEVYISPSEWRTYRLHTSLSFLKLVYIGFPLKVKSFKHAYILFSSRIHIILRGTLFCIGRTVYWRCTSADHCVYRQLQHQPAIVAPWAYFLAQAQKNIWKFTKTLFTRYYLTLFPCLRKEGEKVYEKYKKVSFIVFCVIFLFITLLTFPHKNEEIHLLTMSF